MRKTILENVFINLFIRGITYLFSFLIVFYAARMLQPEAYGRASFAASFTSYFIMLANLGMPIYAMRLCAEKKEDKSALSQAVNELWSIGILLSGISIVVFFIIILFVPKLREDKLLLLIYGCGIVLQVFNCEWLFKGLEKFRFLAGTLLGCKVISLLFMVMFVRSQVQLPLYALLSVLTAHGSNVIGFIVMRKYVDFSWKIHVNRTHLKPLLLFFLMSCAVSIYSSLDLTMLGFMKTDLETGLYTVAAKGKSVLTLIGGVVWTSILPQATRLWKEGKREQFESLAGKSMMIVLGIQFLVTLICWILSRKIVVAVGGEAYAGAETSFRILLLTLVPIGVSNILGGQVLIPAGEEKCLFIAEVAGAVVNFVANLFIIPLYSIEGAAATTVLSEVLVCVICMYYAKKKLGMDFCMGLIRKVVRKIQRLLRKSIIRCGSRISGDKLPFYCACCDTYLKRFIDVGFDKQPDRYNPDRYKNMDQQVICPICGSLPRHRILVAWLDEHMSDVKEKDILHFAQERALRLWMDRNGIISTTADLYCPADMKLDIEDTGLEDNSYDVIICNHVLEHVTDYRKALQELHRIIRPTGKVIISFPVDQSLSTVYEDSSITTEKERIQCFGQNDHLRVFGMDSPEMLEGFGFKVTAIRGADCDEKIKPVVGPADYDYNVLWVLEKESDS